MRNKIVELLKERKITKAQMSRDIDFTPCYINLIIKGKNDGSYKFWRNLQQAYNISDEEIELYKQKG